MFNPARKVFRKMAPLSLAILGIGVAGCVAVWFMTAEIIDRAGQRDFENRAELGRNSIQQQMEQYSALVESFSGLFNVADNFNRLTFHDYARSLELDNRYPGLHNISFARFVLESERDSFQARVRDDRLLHPEGYPGFRIIPQGDGDSVVIEYVEPADKIPTAMGINLLASAERRQPLLLARDEGILTLSGPLRLRDDPEGMMSVTMRMPLFHDSAIIPETGPERIELFAGVIDLAIRVSPMVDAAMDEAALAGMGVVIRDVGLIGQPAEALLLHHHLSPNDVRDVGQPVGSALLENRHIEIGGRVWEIEFFPTTAYVGPIERAMPWLPGPFRAESLIPWVMSMGGLVALLLLVGLLQSQFNARNQAQRLAHKMTSDLRQSETRLREAQQLAHLGNWRLDTATGQVQWSDEIYHILGVPRWRAPYSSEELIERIPPEYRFRGDEALGKTPEPAFEAEYPIRRDDGSQVWVHTRAEPRLDDHGEVESWLGTMMDISQRKQAELALMAEKERAQVTLEAISDGVVVSDVRGKVTYLNPAARKLTGWSLEQAEGVDLSEVLRVRPAPGAPAIAAPVDAWLGSARSSPGDQPLLFSRNGSEHIIEVSAARMHDEHNNDQGVVLILHDVSERHEFERQLAWQASHDALTGLYNRYEFEKRVEALLQGQSNPGGDNALIYLDLDQFKVVNDSCGHTVGDELLRRLTALLAHMVGKPHTLARLGGDEFGILLRNCPLDEALRLGEQLINAINDFRFEWEGSAFTVGASAGLVVPEIGQDTLNSVMSAADSACYAAKDKGRNRIQVYQRDDQELLLRQDEMNWVGRITDALDNNRFELYYQRLQRLDDKPETGERIEILLRMRDVNGEIIAPGSFIPAAERYNLMPAVDRWVIRHVFQQLAQHLNHGEQVPESVGINLSGTSLSDEALPDYVREQLASTGIPPRLVCFEITETAAISHRTAAMRFIEAMRELGCSLALDDFGSGLSSFEYLRSLDVQNLKIDGAFIRDMDRNRIDRAMVQAIERVAEVMQLETVAEFIERPELIPLARELGLTWAQGYAVHRPTPWRAREAQPA